MTDGVSLFGFYGRPREILFPVRDHYKLRIVHEGLVHRLLQFALVSRFLLVNGFQDLTFSSAVTLSIFCMILSAHCTAAAAIESRSWAVSSIEQVVSGFQVTRY